MSVQTLDYASLGLLDDGVIAAAVDHHLKRVYADCSDRSGEIKPRKLTIEVLVAPLPDQSGHAEDVEVQATVKSSLPNHRSKSYRMGLRYLGAKKEPVAVFNNDSLDNPDQGTLFGAPSSYNGDDDE